MKKDKITRRKFVAGSAGVALSAMIVPRHVLGGVGFTAPSDTVNFALIGCGGQGKTDSGELVAGGQNLVALCDVDFGYEIPNVSRFRANFFNQKNGIGAVFRTIPTKILSLDQLNVPAGIRKLAELRAGLVLVTGPTGSGKSTTLAAMIDHINRSRAGHILTIEDPVEFVHTPQRCLVSHKEVGDHVHSFLEAIRSAGREDADVILVGELRGAETMKAALQLASFGILIFATVHTNSAAATIDRFVNAFPADQQPQIRGLLADSLAGVVAQQLLRRADAPGRVAAHEILLGNYALSSLIREGKTAQIASFIQASAGDGMQSMDAALERLAAAGTITARDALDKALDKEAFAKLRP